MPKTEIQTLMARVSSDYIRENGWNPKVTPASELPDTAFSFVWLTTATCPNVHVARAARMPEQRIVRKPTGQYPATVVCKTTGATWYIFDPAITPRKEIETAAIARLKQVKI